MEKINITSTNESFVHEYIVKRWYTRLILFLIFGSVILRVLENPLHFDNRNSYYGWGLSLIVLFALMFGTIDKTIYFLKFAYGLSKEWREPARSNYVIVSRRKLKRKRLIILFWCGLVCLAILITGAYFHQEIVYVIGYLLGLLVLAVFIIIGIMD